MIFLGPYQCHVVWAMDSDCYHTSFEAFQVRSLHSQDDRVNVNFMPFLQKILVERSVLLHCGLVFVIVKN